MKKRDIIIVVFFVLLVAGCEAVKGAGKDMQNTGKNIQKEAEKAE